MIDTKELLEKGIEIENKEFIPGEVIYSDSKKGLFIKTKEGIIEILEIQGENAKKMNISDYLLGNKVETGEIFK
ncbi:methionyl-tRNA formyltransferase [compost metagenome]